MMTKRASRLGRLTNLDNVYIYIYMYIYICIYIYTDIKILYTQINNNDKYIYIGLTDQTSPCLDPVDRGTSLMPSD